MTQTDLKEIFRQNAVHKRYWLICYVWKKKFRWNYANAVIDEHPTAWLVTNREHPEGRRVLVSYHEIMPYEYNDLRVPMISPMPRLMAKKKRAKKKPDQRTIKSSKKVGTVSRAAVRKAVRKQQTAMSDT